MSRLPASPLRIFWFSALVTLASTAAVLFGLGWQATLVTLILVAVEVTFSFDNAIINAKILAKMSPAWQKAFLTIGVVIAIFGMRVVFPILIVSLTAHLSWARVLDLALHHPAAYADKLEHAHVSIAAFGGAFLLMLALHFFVDETREVLWLARLERRLQQFSRVWAPALITLVAIGIMAALPANHHKAETLIAGALGIIVYGAMQLVTVLMGKLQKTEVHTSTHYVGMAALVSFLYLEVLDASFSFDGVIGAFAITNKVILIAAGLGIGALWVRSLTVYMVKRQTLGSYQYLEHGAHYAVLVLALILLVSLVVAVPDMVAGVTGIALIVASLVASRRVLTAKNGL